MDIIIINDFKRIYGGADAVAISEANALVRGGYRVTYICGADDDLSDLVPSENLKTITLGYENIRSAKTPLVNALAGIWNKRTPHDLSAILANFDKHKTILHLHGWTKCLSPSVFSAIKQSGFSSVQTLHDYVQSCPNGTFFDHRQGEICRRKPMSLPCITCACDRGSRAHKVFRIVRQIGLMRALRKKGPNFNYIFVSDFSRRISEKYLPKGARSVVLSNPIHFQSLSRVEAEKNSRLLFIGRLVPEKGPQLLAEAAKGSRNLVFIGDGDLRAQLQQTCPTAEFLGWVSRDRVAAELRRARCLVFPSIWYEAQPLTVPEALAQGIPCVVSRLCAASESIVDGKTGLLFDPTVPGDLVTKLKAFDDDRLVETMSQNAYERFHASPPSESIHATELVTHYREVLSNFNDLMGHSHQASS